MAGLDLYVCPACRGELSEAASGSVLRCAACDVDYRVVDGIPVFTTEDSVSSASDKAKQAAFFDNEDSEFEISRPHGTPLLYQHLLAEKFDRATSRLRVVADGASALVVCGGSGMDAEFLARAGARVVSSDISLGAARRARERAARFGFSLSPVVADVEHLPFRDRAFDLVYVHDGLHHLERPLEGLGEMTRVAAKAVSVTEPARAAITALAVRLGLAQAREDAGNEVMRLTADELCSELRAAGFQVLEARRYGMVYRHHPGQVARLLSHRLVLPVVEAGSRGFNVVAGRYGNKLAVQAIRDERTTP